MRTVAMIRCVGAFENLKSESGYSIHVLRRTWLLFGVPVYSNITYYPI